MNIKSENKATNLAESNVKIEVCLGASYQPLKNLAAMGEGTIIELDRLAGEPVDIRVGETVVGRGEVVVIDEAFGVRVTELFGAKR